MGDNGLSYKPQKLCSSQALSLLKQLEVQHVITEKITIVLRVGNMWILVDIDIRNYCAQFYKPELDSRIKVIDHILRIANFGKVSHMVCWLYCIDLYGRLF
jgi:hypothetical protein